MKFLCDRCKTRYSIGDERVRGKILKIRCKNCANVITVREGMPEPAATDAERRRPTSQAPLVGAPSPGALGAAFASQLAKPPPALEEEWYVSIDGQQSGPFTLADAQRWVAAKPFDAELHCWSEGFDDWLLVDKVSHFRGLRKPPAARRPTAPPPIPSPAPKPLFAATMASIEKSASGPTKLPSISGVQGVGSVSSAASSARTNGAAARQMPGPTPSSFRDDTAIDKPTFTDEVATRAEPAVHRRELPVPMKPVVAPAATAKPVPPAAKYTIPVPVVDDDDNLEIGEVSRVVNLSELPWLDRQASPQVPSRKVGSSTASVQRLGMSTSSVQRLGTATGSVPRMSPSQLGMNVDPSLAALSPNGEPVADESLVARSFAQRHRRGMLALLTVSAVMVLGVIVLVVYVVSGGSSEEMPGNLGGPRVIDTTRPEDIVRRQAGLPPTPAGSATAPIRPHIRTNHPVTQPQVETDSSGTKLDPSEIEGMAAKNIEGTKRCFIRAQKGALGLEMADLKKIDVTLSVNKDGSVSEVQLSSHGGDMLGQCLVNRIKSWRFRESRGGTFRIALAFAAS